MRAAGRSLGYDECVASGTRGNLEPAPVAAHQHGTDVETMTQPQTEEGHDDGQRTGIGDGRVGVVGRAVKRQRRVAMDTSDVAVDRSATQAVKRIRPATYDPKPGPGDPEGDANLMGETVRVRRG